MLVRYGCASRRYRSYVAGLPPISLNDLALVPNSRTLFFGTSFTREIVENLLCAAGFDKGGVECRLVHEYPRLPSFMSWTASCFVAARNATLLAIINDPFLQSSRFGLHKLAHWLHTQPPLDFALFTPAHPECWHVFYAEWILNGTHPSAQKACWVDLNGSSATVKTPSDGRDRQTWSLLRAASRRGAWEVGVWHDTVRGPKVVEPINSSRFYDAGVPVRAYPCQAKSSAAVLAKTPVDDDECASTANGHQCLIGGVTEAARQLVKRLADAAPRRGSRGTAPHERTPKRAK